MNKGGDFIEVLNLKNDYTFKRVFGFIGNEDITIGLLNSILKEPVSHINLDCKELSEKDLYDDKLGILDIRAKLNDSIDCDIEMQLVDQQNIEKRILFYLSKMYTQGIKSGHDYSEINKCIAILFTDFDITNLKEIPKYMTKWNIREEEFSTVILTDAIEIYIIEMSKIAQYKENTNLDTWVKFISNSGDVDMDKADESIKKAKEVLEEISQDSHEQYLAHLREKYILDQNNIRKTGFDEGYEQGTLQSKIKMAKDLKDRNVDINIIIETTGLTKEEIEKL